MICLYDKTPKEFMRKVIIIIFIIMIMYLYFFVINMSSLLARLVWCVFMSKFQIIIIIIIIIINIHSLFLFPSVIADSFSLESKWQQVSSSLQDSS